MNKTCETCFWHTYDIDFGGWFCLNIDSPLSAEDVDPDDTCRAWEEKND